MLRLHSGWYWLQARTDAENATEITRRRSRLGDVVKDVSTAFDSDLTRIAGRILHLSCVTASPVTMLQ